MMKCVVRMPDTQSLGILKTMCEVVRGQQADRKVNSKTLKLTSTLNCKTNTDQEIRSDNVDVINANPNYFRSRTDRGAEKKASWVLVK